MRKAIIFIVILLFGFNTWAGIVDITKARAVAINFYTERANSVKPILKESIKISDEVVIMNNNEAVYYIFNIENEMGYVIVSAESNVTPILAYSFENSYPINSLNPTLKWIANSYKNEIVNNRKNNYQATDEITRLWSLYSNEIKTTNSVNQVLPLLGTINWDQGCYYNTSCPSNTDQTFCNHNPTGCVATAMAMIMKYNSYPTQGTGSYSYIHSTTYGYTNNYGTLSANFGATTYNWSVMSNVVTSTNSNVATLMSHCGISVGMSYDANGSGAIVGAASNYQGPTAEKALKTYFKYNTAKYYKKSAYTNSQWQALILSDVDANRPILYAGDDGSAGHAFVLDGYQVASSNYHYHFNFGWSGSGNGYFYIDTICPGDGGVGGGTYNFSSNEEGIFSLAKSTAGIESSEKVDANIYPNPSNGNITIELPENINSKVNIEIFNIIGENVWNNDYSVQNNSININLNSLIKGVYFINIKTETLSFTKKITIVR